MPKVECTSCQKPKATLHCGICQTDLCKYCAQFVDEDGFSFLSEIPAEISHTTYCQSCFEQNVAPALHDYNQLMEQAKEIAVFFDNQGKETRLIKRTEEPYLVKDCADRNETIMRLAFFAAQAGFNSLIDVRVTSTKVKEGSRQSLKWDGYAIPAYVNPEKLIRDRSFWNNPN